MLGKNEMIDDILQSARKTSAAMISEATEAADKEIADLRAELEALKQKSDAATAAAADSLYAGRVKLGELEAGKIVLKAKSECVAAVYDAVAQKFDAMPTADYLKLMQTLIEEYCTDGDEIVAGKTDKRITDDFVKKVSKSAKKKLKLSKEKGDFTGGVILKNDKFEIDLTIGAIIADLKERTVEDTAKKLGL